MNYQRLARWLMGVALAATILGGAGAYRFYRTVPELRFPETEALWQLLPFGILLLIIAAWVLTHLSGTSSPRPGNST